MDIGRRALYNLLRINWKEDPQGEVAPWKVEDYRTLDLEQLFYRLQELEFSIDKIIFHEYIEHVETPEELAETLVESDDPEVEDRVYLLVFELWRRLALQKPSLSIFCDELDYQIELYDQGNLKTFEGLESALRNLQEILEDSADEGKEDVKELFLSVSEGLANDVESFIYDFISDQMDNNHYPYAVELLEGFYEYMQDDLWFDFLKARLAFRESPEESSRMIYTILVHRKEELHIELLFDMLNHLVQNGEPSLFFEIVKLQIFMIEVEEDFQDLLGLISKFLQGLDKDQEEQLIHEIIKKRSSLSSDISFSSEHSDVQILLNTIDLSLSHS
jgi:hypothetical protein